MITVQARTRNSPARPKKSDQADVPDLATVKDLLHIGARSSNGFVESLPFSFRDVTAGTENEFQTVVLGKRQNQDLAIAIESSNFYKNMIRRAASGDISNKNVLALEQYLEDKNDVWENTWVRFPEQALNRYARHIFNADLKSDKTDPASLQRTDTDRFFFTQNKESFIRIPVSYLLKLAMADLIGSRNKLHPFIRITGEKMMAHFLNDNTSPEITSFHPVRSRESRGIGPQVARETLIRFMLTQLLVQYAEKKFRLLEYGQQVRVFFSASPPLMQQRLNACISDAFYRHLFMSPCLSGWARGQEKHDYMHLCHQVLSRSQINGIAKLKEAGIINSNLVVLPNTSNISLANNGTHISIGSRKLSRLLADPGSGFTPVHEKYTGDLVIKVVEHFLCLFPGTFSAAPFRLDFTDFHPEKLLGFLPHELDYTHLRMIWRRWKGKAANRILGRPMTPFGPLWLDRLISRAGFLKGDFVPDFRLMDYLVCPMSTDQSPALDGRPGNDMQLKKDLAEMGIFDTRMSLYQLVKLREFSTMGFSGLEHRYYSIFEDIVPDMGGAADLQTLITALAWQYIVTQNVTHDMIPDAPDIESERRQIFFCSAVDLPTFYVNTRTRNLFLQKIVSKISKTRASRRYPGYTRIRLHDYKLALIQTIQTDAGDLVDHLGMKAAMADLERRIRFPGTHAASGRLVSGILAGDKKKNPMAFEAQTFNAKAESYYIDGLRQKHITAGFALLTEELCRLDLWACFREPAFKQVLTDILGETDITTFLKQVKDQLSAENLSMEHLQKLMFLIILYVNKETKNFETV
ncbi:MAG: hypothetical protein LC660_13000 [Desulfobacteraceae bacterium]|nr:hypothetical protein [Desulfobacteraceae bacterium]